MSEPNCQAVQLSDLMVCEGCKVKWDVNDPDPPECMPIEVRVDLREIKGVDHIDIEVRVGELLVKRLD